MTTIKLLVPAAGFGTRAGNHLSKEMLLAPTGQKFIDGPLDCGFRHGLPVHVITRSEKVNLISYLEEVSCRPTDSGLGWKVETQLISPTPDWPQTLLESEKFWADWNLVFLPDVQWKPLDMMDQIIQQIQSGHCQEDQVLCARFPTLQCHLFGSILEETEDISQPMLRLCEKPSDLQGQRGHAWGIFGFRKEVGKKLLQAMAQSTLDHQWKKLPLKLKFFELESFEDLTRVRI